MIRFYSGTPGSGKSLHAAADIYEWLRSGKNVIANFAVRDDLVKPKGKKKPLGHFIYYKNVDLMNEESDPVSCLTGFALNFHSKDKDGRMMEGQTLLVIDEAGIVFNSRDWHSKYRPAWLEFFAQHRKYGYEIIMVAQSERQIDRQIRANFEYEYTHKRVGNFKRLGKLLELGGVRKMFCYVVRWYGIKGQDGRVAAKFFHAEKKYCRLYNTTALFGR